MSFPRHNLCALLLSVSVACWESPLIALPTDPDIEAASDSRRPEIDTHPHGFGPEDTASLSFVTNQISYAIDQVSLFDAMRAAMVWCRKTDRIYA
jgi:hypothetical protein